MKGGQQRPASLEIDTQKTIIYKAIHEADSKSAAASSLVFWRRPDEVRTSSKTIAKGQLVLAPVVGLLGIATKSVPKAIPIHEANGVKYFAIEPAKPAHKVDETTFPPEAIIAAFWWVTTTHDKSLPTCSCRL